MHTRHKITYPILPSSGVLKSCNTFSAYAKVFFRVFFLTMTIHTEFQYCGKEQRQEQTGSSLYNGQKINEKKRQKGHESNSCASGLRFLMKCKGTRFSYFSETQRLLKVLQFTVLSKNIHRRNGIISQFSYMIFPLAYREEHKFLSTLAFLSHKQMLH